MFPRVAIVFLPPRRRVARHRGRHAGCGATGTSFPAIVEIDTTHDIYAVGDVHGDYERLISLLIAAKVNPGRIRGRRRRYSGAPARRYSSVPAISSTSGTNRCASSPSFGHFRSKR